MSSSDSTGAGGKAMAAEHRIAPSPAADDGSPDDPDHDAAADPWFTPGPKRTADESPDAADAALGPPTGGAAPAEWFLPTGRAALLPDSVTDSGADGSLSGPVALTHSEAASFPPWVAEPTGPLGSPPPWENGPWPGPGDSRQPSHPRSPASSGDQTDSEADAAVARRRPVQLALATGAGAVVVIVVIVVIVTAMSSGPTGGCGTYPAAVRQAYVGAMTDVRTHAPPPVQSAAFQLAASRANSSAAAAGEIGVRTALFAMASDLDQAHADVAAHRALPPTLVQHLAADGSALPASCPS
jgi:hypothetical protein